MEKKYTISLMGIIILIILLFVVYNNYRMYTSQTQDKTAVTLMSDDLSINFLQGNPIRVKEDYKTIDFSITNYSSKTIYYTISINVLEGKQEGITTLLKEENNELQSFSNENKINIKEISEGETKRYSMQIEKKSSDDFVFEIVVKTERKNHDFGSLLISSGTKEDNTITFQEIEEENGLYHRQEQDGDIYYFRGNVKNNYVSFANLLWRIVKINENGTIKLVMDSTTESMEQMTLKEGETFLETSLYSSLESWYETHLKEYDSYITSAKYCYDNGIAEENSTSYTYLSWNRLFTDYLPTNTCNGTEITSKIALLTADEVMYAGGAIKENKSYYLYDESLQAGWWTMTPSKKDENGTYFISVSSDGSLRKEEIESNKLFVKPSITLNRKLKMLGEGTKENPYYLE